MVDVSSIPSSQVPIVDQNQITTPVWFRFFGTLYRLCGNGINYPQLSNYVVLPNVTTAQKLAITSPELGRMVFDTTLDRACVYTSAGWRTIA